jgi:hypothetical protein
MPDHQRLGRGDRRWGKLGRSYEQHDVDALQWLVQRGGHGQLVGEAETSEERPVLMVRSVGLDHLLHPAPTAACQPASRPSRPAPCPRSGADHTDGHPRQLLNSAGDDAFHSVLPTPSGQDQRPRAFAVVPATSPVRRRR